MFEQTDPRSLNENPFDLIGSQWALVSAGSESAFNMMTISWGGLGVLWNRDVVFCFIRPTRHTYQFVEREPKFALSFFDETYRHALNVCGSRSGRDTDKCRAAGLTPESGSPVYFAEARLVLICRKLYYQDFDPGHFIDPAIARNYSGNDYHRMYVGEIEKCLTRS